MGGGYFFNVHPVDTECINTILNIAILLQNKIITQTLRITLTLTLNLTIDSHCNAGIVSSAAPTGVGIEALAIGTGVVQ